MDRQKRPSYQGESSGRPSYTSSQGHRHRSPKPVTGNFIYEVYHAGIRKIHRMSGISLFLLSILAGAFICAGTLVSIILFANTTLPSMQYLTSALGLTIGLLFVVLTNSALVTEGNIYGSSIFYNVSIARGCLRLFRFWGIVLLGNVIGAVLFSLLVSLTMDHSSSLLQNLTSIVVTRLAHVSNGHFRTISELIISGMLANWFIALMSFIALYSRQLINQFIGIFLVFLLVLTLNLQYFPVNLSYFSLNAFLGQGIGLIDIIFSNLIPVLLGNILGASLLVSGSLMFLSKKRN